MLYITLRKHLSPSYVIGASKTIVVLSLQASTATINGENVDDFTVNYHRRVHPLRVGPLLLLEMDPSLDQEQ